MRKGKLDAHVVMAILGTETQMWRRTLQDDQPTGGKDLDGCCLSHVSMRHQTMLLSFHDGTSKRFDCGEIDFVWNEKQKKGKVSSASIALTRSGENITLLRLVYMGDPLNARKIRDQAKKDDRRRPPA